MITDLQLDALEAAARSWAGTPFCEGTPLKGVGVSCHHAVAEIYFECGLVQRIPVPNGPSHYSPAQTRSLIAEWVDASGLFDSIPLPADTAGRERSILPGDMLGFRVVNAVHHAAIALRSGRIVHSIMRHGVMIAPAIPAAWSLRLERVWRLKNPGA